MAPLTQLIDGGKWSSPEPTASPPGPHEGPPPLCRHLSAGTAHLLTWQLPGPMSASLDEGRPSPSADPDADTLLPWLLGLTETPSRPAWGGMGDGQGDTPGVQGSFWAGRIATSGSGSRAWLFPPPSLPPQRETAGQTHTCLADTHLPGSLCSTHKTSPAVAPHPPLPPFTAPHPCCLGLHVPGNPGLGLCPGAGGLGTPTVLPLGAGSEARKLR